MRTSLFLLFTLTWGLAAAPASDAETWTLEPEESRLFFGSIKADAVGESHQFQEFSGQVDETGRFDLTIDLASLETGIDIRNKRMREFLFETANFDQATLVGELDLDAYRDLAVGEMTRTSLTATLSLHGAENELQADVAAVRLADNKVAVFPAQLMFINAEAYGLGDGVDKLRQLAGLPSIASAVPLSFNLVFTRDH